MSVLGKLSLAVLLAACGVLNISCGEGESDRGPGSQPVTGTIKVGFAQMDSESDWRLANTASVKSEAAKRGIDLVFTNAQGKQENQIKSLRSFIQQKVDVIVFSPHVESGYEPILREIKAAGIPVILTGRTVDVTDHSLYVTFIGADFVEEGRRAAQWFVKNTTGDVRVFELRGTPGSSPANDRNKGFLEGIADCSRITIIKSQDGDFRSSKGKEVTEAFLRTDESKGLNAVYAHNDDMAFGAIQAMEEAGLKPGTDIKVVSIDGVRAAFNAIIAGKLNCTVECNPLVGPDIFDMVEAIARKRIITAEGVFDHTNAAEALKTRQY